MTAQVPLGDRVNFKLFAARRHLENLTELEDRTGSLAAAEVRNQAEIEIDELLYHLVGVRDALLQEINTELNLGLPQRDVNLGAINNRLNQRGANARNITREIDDMGSNQQNPLWLVAELHNLSEHRALIGQEIVVVDGQLQRASLIDPRTEQGMGNDRGERILAIDYLADSLRRIENLRDIVRERIRQFRNPTTP
jgi:hypothetical protein